MALAGPGDSLADVGRRRDVQQKKWEQEKRAPRRSFWGQIHKYEIAFDGAVVGDKVLIMLGLRRTRQDGIFFMSRKSCKLRWDHNMVLM